MKQTFFAVIMGLVVLLAEAASGAISYAWGTKEGLVPDDRFSLVAMTGTIEYHVVFDPFGPETGYTYSDRYSISLLPGEETTISIDAEDYLYVTVFTDGTANPDYVFQSQIEYRPLKKGSFTIKYNATYPTLYLCVGATYGTAGGDYDIDYTLTSRITDLHPGPDADLLVDTPPGWDDAIVVSTVAGTTTDAETIYRTNSIYADFALINLNTNGINAEAFNVKLYLDGILNKTWTAAGLDALRWAAVQDYGLGTLSAGTHTLRLVVDSEDTVAESNESNNTYTRTFTVRALPCRISFLPGAHGSIPVANAGSAYEVVVDENTAFPSSPSVNPDSSWVFAGWDPKPPQAISNDFSTTAVYLPKYMGGGTSADPYLIQNKSDVLALSVSTNDWGRYFKLLANIDMGGEVFDQAVIGAYEAAPFSGIFDGDGYVISNFVINASSRDVDYVGLFGKITGKVLCLGISSGDITGDENQHYVGGLCGINVGSVSKSYFKGKVSGSCTSGYLGGFCGYNSRSGTGANNCYVDASVISLGSCGGGFCGGNSGIISNCYSVGSVSSTTNRNYGFNGGNYLGGKVVKCFWNTQIAGTSLDVGGIGKTTAQMQLQATFSTVGWDFVGETANGTSDIWVMRGYPRLAWEQVEVAEPSFITISGPERINPSFAIRGLNCLFSSVSGQRSALHFFFSSSSRGGGCSGKIRLS